MSEPQITYQVGDATNPEIEGNKLILHCCNDVGAWGKGFVLAISKRWSTPKKAYKRWYKGRFDDDSDFGLGAVQFVQVDTDIWVGNLVGQRGISSKFNPFPVRYDAIEQGLIKSADFAINNHCSIHMPYIGCGLAGGDWKRVSSIIKQTLINKGLPVTVYSLL
jgi:O-acetyl-ADP-ribose deacetylase (regulator of RNase III)